jgi:hypothetical protein
MKSKSTLPAPQICKCGHRVKWFVPCKPGEDDRPDWFTSDYHIEEDVAELPCPHRNGTVIQYCPQCNREVGIRSAGTAGSMECGCWDERPWWRRFLNLLP